jgi:hypothetical protein
MFIQEPIRRSTTRNVRGKTVRAALSREQYEWLRTAIANWQEVQHTLKEMQCPSREALFTTCHIRLDGSFGSLIRSGGAP